tara:strand:- start:139 stop:678 length:540 start_codon:yes stop_codon:yes gene_type:complete
MPLIVRPQPDIDEPIDELDLPPESRRLGAAGGLDWYRIPEGATAPAGTRAPTDAELNSARLDLPPVRQLKASARRRIEAEAGDIHDIVADQARQIEALMALAVRLGQVVLGGETLDPDVQHRYLDRIAPLAQALDNGSLTLRGDLEDPDAMLARMQARTDRINDIIAAEYLPRRAELLN